MGVYKFILRTLCLVVIMNSIESKEFTPVYMWSTKSLNEKIPALHRISEESFKEDMQERVKDHLFVVIFAEQTLSPEDFAQRNPSGGLIFSHLANHKNTLYLPNVQNPIEAVKNLETTILEIPVKNLSEFEKNPETGILIINLNDAKDVENRLDMLQRHDEYINFIYETIRKKYDNVLILYTSKHTSWVGSENIRSRKSRDLLQVEEESSEGHLYTTSNVLIYLSRAYYYEGKKNHKDVIPFTFSDVHSKNVNNVSIDVNLTSSNLEVKFNFTNYFGYYELVQPILAIWSNGSHIAKYNLTSNSELYAPYGFSYHCGNQSFSNENFTLLLDDFQIQVFFDEILNVTEIYKFSDTYDCVGFTSVPIWSGIFVTTILLIIMTFGITMMMDIRTMDRFDDAKGKTITINAE